MKSILLTLVLIISFIANAAPANPMKKENVYKIEQPIAGDLLGKKSDSVKSWRKKCRAWLDKSKIEYAKSYDILMMFCGLPKCTSSPSKIQCSSKAKFNFSDRHVIAIPNPVQAAFPTQKNRKTR